MFFKQALAKASFMRQDIIAVDVQGLVPTNQGSALFLGNTNKTILIYVDNHMGKLILAGLRGDKRERPMTHDLILTIFQGFEIALDKVIINYAHEGTFHARLILSMKNELGFKLVELDARPSDSIVLAIQKNRPIYINKAVLDTLEDVTDILRKIFKQQPGIYPPYPEI